MADDSSNPNYTASESTEQRRGALSPVHLAKMVLATALLLLAAGAMIVHSFIFGYFALIAAIVLTFLDIREG